MLWAVPISDVVDYDDDSEINIKIKQENCLFEHSTQTTSIRF